MSGLAEVVEATILAHRATATMFCRSCPSWRPEDVLEDEEEYMPRHAAAEVTRAVSEWLGEQRETVAEAIHGSDCGCPAWHADDQEDITYREHADVALDAIRGQIGVE